MAANVIELRHLLPVLMSFAWQICEVQGEFEILKGVAVLINYRFVYVWRLLRLLLAFFSSCLTLHRPCEFLMLFRY